MIWLSNRNILLIGFLLLTFSAKSQQGLLLDFQIAPGKTLLSVTDEDPAPSAENIVADGFTENVENQSGLVVRLSVEKPYSEKMNISTGLWFSGKQMLIRNTDGTYIGVSNYKATYIELPFILKWQLKEFNDRLVWKLGAGPLVGIKANEKLIGSDFAHYWNLSRNRFDLDPTRGRNGNGKSKKLFNPLELSIYLSTGLAYDVGGGFQVFGGLSYTHSFFNMINPSLKFNDGNTTKVKESIKIRSSLLTVDFGVAFPLDKLQQ